MSSEVGKNRWLQIVGRRLFKLTNKILPLQIKLFYFGASPAEYKKDKHNYIRFPSPVAEDVFKADEVGDGTVEKLYYY